MKKFLCIHTRLFWVLSLSVAVTVVMTDPMDHVSVIDTWLFWVVECGGGLGGGVML